MTKELKAWEKATQELADAFVKKYYGDNASDVYWTDYDDKVGGILVVNDDFWDIGEIVDALRYKCKPKDLFKWKGLKLKVGLNGKKYPVSLRNYALYGDDMLELEKKINKKDIEKLTKEFEKEIKKFKASDLW
ncbi:MAG: hypothetical protein ACRC6O_13285 [Flavobacterium sp.]